MFFISYMIRQAMPPSVDTKQALKHADFVRGALIKSPVHVRLGITVLTLAYFPLSYMGLGTVARKISFFNLLIRVYRSLVFLQLFSSNPTHKTG